MPLALLLAGGVSIFLVGLRGISTSMGALFSHGLRERLGNLPGKRKWQVFILAVLFTSLVQSSSAVTVIGVALVNAGVLSVADAVVLTLGANVGTTMTGQLVSWSLRDSIPWLLGFGLSTLLLGQVFKGDRKTLIQTGLALSGLGLLFTGFELLQISLGTLAQNPKFTLSVLGWMQRGWAEGFFAGLAGTAVLQSSSLVIASTISLLNTGAIPFNTGLWAMLGSNIGTSVTTILAGIGGGRAGKAASLANLTFNVLSMIIIIPFLELLAICALASSPNPGRQLANAHTLFNLSTALALLPFSRQLAKVLSKVVNFGERED